MLLLSSRPLAFVALLITAAQAASSVRKLQVERTETLDDGAVVTIIVNSGSTLR